MEVKELHALLKKQKNGTLSQTSVWDKIRKDYIEEKSVEYADLPIKEGIVKIISEQNHRERSRCYSCYERGICINVGDICFIDFGEAYINEAGFQHFGVIISIFHGKALVIPMSSNPITYAQAYHQDNPTGKKHLMQIGLIPGLVKKSVLFLNDAKFINTARIIEVKAHLEEDSVLFQMMKERLKACID